MARMPLQLSVHPNIMQYNYSMPFHPSAYTTYASANDMSHICVRRQHMSHISWCFIETSPLLLSIHFSYKLLQWPFISWHKRSLGELATVLCPSISTTWYRSRVYYDHIHSNNIKYHNDSTGDIQWIVSTR